MVLLPYFNGKNIEIIKHWYYNLNMCIDITM